MPAARDVRPLATASAGYIAGIALGRLFLEDPVTALMVLAPLLAAVFFGVSRRILSKSMAALLLCLAGAGAAAFFAAAAPEEGELTRLAGGPPLFVEGTVVEEPVRESEYTSYVVRAEAVQTAEGRRPVSGRLLVRIYGEEGGFRYGERLRLRGYITAPRGRRNPGGFDYRFYLRARGIEALMYLQPYQAVSLGEGSPGRLAAAAVGLRQKMSAAIDRALPSPAADLLAALLFGQRGRLPDHVQENLTRSGVGHLVAVSGLHVGLVASLILGLWRRLGLRGRLPLLLAVLLIFGYAFLTGMRPAALRAAVMLSMALGALLIDRERDVPTAVAAAALLTLGLNPLLLFDVGFQLSYAATLSIIYLSPPLMAVLARLPLPPYIRSLTAVSLSAQLGVLPLTAFHFQHLPLAALLFNLLILPVMPFVVALGALGALCALTHPLIGAPFLLAVRPLLEYMLFIPSLARLPGLFLETPPPSPAAMAAFYAALFLPAALYFAWQRERAGQPSLSWRGYLSAHTKPLLRFLPRRPFYALAALLAAALLWLGASLRAPSSGGLLVTYLDVGQGAAALVETPGGLRFLVDAGGGLAFRDEPEEVGEKILLPFLRYKGISSLDLAVITHPHEDHFCGLVALPGRIAVREMLVSPDPGDSAYYRELLDSLRARGTTVAVPAAGDTFRCPGGLVMELLGPPPQLYSGTGSDANNNSLVLRLTYGENAFLFCGDIEEAAMRDLLAGGAGLAAEVLLVPHHGGYAESMDAFLQAVDPALAVIPVGKNLFGHPHPETLLALDRAGVTTLRNDLHGAVQVYSDGRSVFYQTMQTPP